MQLRRKLRQIAMHRDQIIIDVARVTGGVAQPRDAGDFGDATQQLPERPGPAETFAMIGVDVLPDQRHLAHARSGEILDLGENCPDGPRNFRAARVGHDAEGAELVAAFLHGDEGRDAARPRLLEARRREEGELVLDRKLGCDHAPLAGEQFGQAVVALRPDHQIDHRRAPDDLFPLRLRHATRDRDRHAAPGARGALLHRAHAPEFGIDLFGRLLADVAGVENDQVGVLRRGGLDVPLGRQQIRHTMRVVDVHLATVGFDVELALHSACGFGALLTSCIS